ncbi:MAG TPA: helix-turn-helix domain-containing protein [Acidimicrobiales bacterium]|nr:helix-turn-helix domain-containing protein [Acidimicrobiales bacterium]
MSRPRSRLAKWLVDQGGYPAWKLGIQSNGFDAVRGLDTVELFAFIDATREAADLLGISRPTFVKLLEDGEMPYEQPGRHRRVLLSDVLAYRQRRSVQAREALDRMVEIADESGMYEFTATPKRTR